jgi:hypothetical protein
MNKPTGYIAAGRAELRSGHDYSTFPPAIEHILQRTRSLLGRDSSGIVSDNSAAQGKTVPSAFGVAKPGGPIFSSATGVSSQQGLASQSYCVENLTGPEDIGNRRSRLRPYFLNQADRFACLRVVASFDLNSRLFLKLGNNRNGYHLIHRTIQNNLPCFLVRPLTAGQYRHEQNRSNHQKTAET